VSTCLVTGTAQTDWFLAAIQIPHTSDQQHTIAQTWTCDRRWIIFHIYATLMYIGLYDPST